jgi:hypothetical protein
VVVELGEDSEISATRVLAEATPPREHTATTGVQLAGAQGKSPTLWNGAPIAVAQ